MHFIILDTAHLVFTLAVAHVHAVMSLEDGKPQYGVDSHSADDYNVNNPPPNYDPTTNPHPIQSDRLQRALSARQVQMIAIGGTIGTGLFLGTGKSLATGGPASILIAYFIVGCIVFFTMLSLGEMAAYIPVAGSFCTFAGLVASLALWLHHD